MRNSKPFKTNNDGFSLIELIVVVAIITIIGGALFLSTTVATDKHVKSCAEKITYSLDQTRNLAMGKQGAYVVLSQSPGDSVYLQMYVDGKPYGELVAVGHSGLTVNVKYVNTHGASYTNSLTSGNATLRFSRSNGSVVGEDYVVSEIEITNGRRTFKITVDRFTGRVSNTLIN